MLKQVSIGWAWLQEHLNLIIDEVNLNKPTASASIAVEQSPNGTVLRVVQKKDDQPNQPGSGQQQQQQPVVWHNVGWATVTIIDTATCQTSNLTVVAQKQGSSITIQ